MLSRNVSRQHCRIVAAAAQKPNVRICTGKVCKKQGSQQVLKFGQDLGLEEVDIVECGCLGNCGMGPNMAILPEGLLLRHVATPSDLADILTWQLKVAVPDDVIRATQLRLAGNQHAMAGDLEAAVATYQQALDLQPSRGRHMLHANLSATHLQLGDKQAALHHAQQAVALAPRGFHVAYIRLVDALYSLGLFREAAEAVQQAVQADPAFKALPEYKVVQQALRKAGVAA